MTRAGASKVIVEEQEPRIRGIAALPTSVAGAVGVTERGPIGKPVRVTSFPEFQEVFGEFTVESDLSLAAAGFFDNGGSQLWACRTVHYADPSDSASATAKVGTVDVASAGGTVARLEGRDPGAYTAALTVFVRPRAAAGTFDLLVEREGTLREGFTDLSVDASAARFAPRVLAAPRTGSRLLRWVPLAGAPPALPTEQTLRLTGGDDGLAGLADEDFTGTERGQNGLRALDPLTDLALVLVPGVATPRVHQAMLQYCEAIRSGQVFAVLDPPADAGADAIVDYVERQARLLERSEFGALYWPRIRIANPSKRVFGPGALVTAPPSGVIAGVLARADAARAGGIYDPPAGIEVGAMRGVFGFDVPDALDEKKRDIVFPKRINPLTTDVGLPFFIDGARTLKGSGNFPYVHERRGVSFIQRSLKQGLQFARHKANTETLRARVRRTIDAFLNTQMRNGAFASQEPDKAYFVDVSERINTPSVVAGGELLADIGLATTKPAEFIVLRVSADTRALEAELAAEEGAA